MRKTKPTGKRSSKNSIEKPISKKTRSTETSYKNALTASVNGTGQKNKKEKPPPKPQSRPPKPPKTAWRAPGQKGSKAETERAAKLKNGNENTSELQVNTEKKTATIRKSVPPSAAPKKGRTRLQASKKEAEKEKNWDNVGKIRKAGIKKPSVKKDIAERLSDAKRAGLLEDVEILRREQDSDGFSKISHRSSYKPSRRASSRIYNIGGRLITDHQLASMRSSLHELLSRDDKDWDEITERMKQLHGMILNSSDLQCNGTIDLHAMFAKEAVEVVKAALNVWNGDLIVIVGLGNHSKNGPKIGPAVRRYLKNMGYKFSNQDGRVIIHRH